MADKVWMVFVYTDEPKNNRYCVDVTAATAREAEWEGKLEVAKTLQVLRPWVRVTDAKAILKKVT